MEESTDLRMKGYFANAQYDSKEITDLRMKGYFISLRSIEYNGKQESAQPF